MLPLMKKIARDGMEYKISESDRREIERRNQTYAENGLRVLAFGYRILCDSNSDLDEDDEENLVYLGMTAVMMDTTSRRRIESGGTVLYRSRYPSGNDYR